MALVVPKEEKKPPPEETRVQTALAWLDIAAGTQLSSLYTPPAKKEGAKEETGGGKKEKEEKGGDTKGGKEDTRGGGTTAGGGEPSPEAAAAKAKADAATEAQALPADVRVEAILKKAGDQIGKWDQLQEEHVAALRFVRESQPVVHKSLRLLELGTMVKGVATGHHMFSTFTKPTVFGLRRWQQASLHPATSP